VLPRYKQNYERMYQLKEWQDCGGVMMIGYDMFRNLTNTQTKRMRKKAIEVFQSTLVDPGDIVFNCDFGMCLITDTPGLCLHFNEHTCVCTQFLFSLCCHSCKYKVCMGVLLSLKYGGKSEREKQVYIHLRYSTLSPPPLPEIASISVCITWCCYVIL
jgi:hypothetical protein